MTDITLVSYLNTIPFMEGLKDEDQFNLNKKTPSQCASAFINEETDIALLPVGSLHLLPPHKIITDYCIGCEGFVKTVVLASQSPLHQINTIYLDNDSRTSALLIKVLMKYYYKKDIEYIQGIPAFPLTIEKKAGILMIGDKVFEYEDKFQYIIDLGEAWKNWQDLPFVFAVWVAKPNIATEVIETLNQALKRGVESIPNTHFDDNNIDLDEYFREYISYDFNSEKRKALHLYKEYINSLIHAETI